MKQKHLLEQFTSDSMTLQVSGSPIAVQKCRITIRENTWAMITHAKKYAYDFRHSHASLLINQGEDYPSCKRTTRTCSITTTIDTYSQRG